MRLRVRPLVFADWSASSSPGRASRRSQSTTDTSARPGVRATRPRVGQTRADSASLDVDLMSGDGRELRTGGQQRCEVKHQLHLELGEDALGRQLVEDRAGNLTVDFEAIDESSRATSSVTTARAACPASRSMRPWPISPPAPVMSTTGLRTRELWRGWWWLLDALLVVVMSGGLSWQNQSSQPAPLPASFDFDKTMRVDYLHTGGPRGPASREIMALNRVVNDGPWGREPTQLVDTTNLGKYLFEVRDKASNSILYSRGFASIYGEWETTAEVRTAHRSFHESLRFPWPKQPVRVTLQKRQPDNRFASIKFGLSMTIRASVRQRRGTPRSCGNGLERLRERSGGGEGRSAAHQRRLHSGRVAKISQGRRSADRRVVREEPFKSRKRDFNVRALELPSPQSGVNRPDTRRLPATIVRPTPDLTQTSC